MVRMPWAWVIAVFFFGGAVECALSNWMGKVASIDSLGRDAILIVGLALVGWPAFRDRPRQTKTWSMRAHGCLTHGYRPQGGGALDPGTPPHQGSGSRPPPPPNTGSTKGEPPPPPLRQVRR